MNYFFRIVIPKETSQESPYEEILKVSYGVIRNVKIYILPGHAGLAGLQIYFHESQVYPLNRDGYYLGDNISVEFEDNYGIHIEPYMLKASGYNEDVRYDHAFLVSLGMLREEHIETETPIPYRTYIGVEGE